MSNPRYSLGIDTGGTFTEGVLLDQHTRQVVRTAKVLTSHHDLRQCIDGILTALQLEDAASIGLVSLSTTLATNAIAEGKRRPVALILMGYDAELVQQYDFQHQFGTDEYYYVPGRHNLNGIEQEALDESILRSAVESARGKVDAYAVASYAGPANGGHHQRNDRTACGAGAPPDQRIGFDPPGDDCQPERFAAWQRPGFFERGGEYAA
jgi:N-methylhydantoinase A/oxoprolinase/acetone carboxylase beta subunit